MLSHAWRRGLGPSAVPPFAQMRIFTVPHPASLFTFHKRNLVHSSRLVFAPYHEW